MADFTTTYNRVILGNEGGYVPASVGIETYRGIDRQHNPTWSGWAIIDAYKRGHGVPPRYYEFKIPGLEDAVIDWYKTVYLKGKIDVDAIASQTLADFLVDFIVHKYYDALKVIVASAKELNPALQATLSVSGPVVELVNEKAQDFYDVLRRNRIEYYKNPRKFGSSYSGFSTGMMLKFIKRVLSFPANLPDVWQLNYFSNLLKSLGLIK